MSDTYIFLPPPSTSGGGAGVSEFNGRDGSVVSQAGDYSASLISNTPSGPVTATDVQGAINEVAGLTLGNSDTFAGYDSTGKLSTVPGYSLNNLGGAQVSITVEPDNEGGGASVTVTSVNLEPLQNSPDNGYTAINNILNVDNANSGFTLATNSNLNLVNNTIRHAGTGTSGPLAATTNYMEIGNGTDAVTVEGFAYSHGFGDIRNNATISGPVQGYGFQPNFAAGSALTSYANAFFDFANMPAMDTYTSFAASPNIVQINNNSNYTGLTLGPNITTLQGNASVTGIGVYGTYTTFGATSAFKGFEVQPNIPSGGTNYIVGARIDMSNVTGSNVKAMEVTGDVSISGALSFTGALSIGQLQAFYQQNPVDGGGNPLNMHGLTTGMTALNGVTVANADAIGVNTAMLIELQEDSVTTSGAFGLGFAALALPCVVRTEANSSLDFMNCAVYALNLDGSSTGGTIDVVNLCRTEAIPNGITTINEMRAFHFNQSFGQVGTDVWGVHVVPTYAENHLGGSLNIGSASRKVSNSDVGLEIGSAKAFLNARMDTTARNALTAINGMQIYNTTTDKLQVYAAGSWVDLH